MHFLKILVGYNINTNVGSVITTSTMQMLRAANGKWSLLKNSTVES